MGLFNRLAVFAGGWTLEAAEVVVADHSSQQDGERRGIDRDDVLGLQATLLDKSLVLFRIRAHRPLSHARDTPPVRPERLAASGEERWARERNRQCCMDLAERGESEIWRADQVLWVRLLANDLDSLRAALRWTLSGAEDADPGRRIGAALGRFWITRGDLREGIDCLRDLLALPSVRARTPGWGRAMTALGYLTSVQGDSDQAVRILHESLSYWREPGEPRALAVALVFRGLVVGWPNFHQTALPF